MISGMLSKMIALKVLKFEGGNVTVKERTVVFIPAEILIFLHDEMAKGHGAGAADKLMFRAGKHQTVTGSTKYFMEKKELRRIFTRVPETGDPSLEMGREILKFAGWGDTRIKSIGRKGDEIILMTENSPIAKEYLKKNGKSKKPVCHYLAGILEGVIESVYDGEFKTVEKACSATGKTDCCIFEFKKVTPRT